MSAAIVNIDNLILEPRPEAMAPAGAAAEKFDAKAALVSRQLGAQKLGYNITGVAPGMRAFPFHNHRVNEEMFFILEGRGEMRAGDRRQSIRQGDLIACPPGGTATAHQFINTGDSELKFLAVSTRLSPEICDYPDTGKFGILAEFDGGEPELFAYVGRREQSLDYWEGE